MSSQRGGGRLARSLDIASLEPSDGILTEQLRRKINRNFQRLASMVTVEQPAAQSDQTASQVRQLVGDLLSQEVPGILADALDAAYPVGSVLVTWSSSDPRLSRGTWQQVGSGRYVRAAGDGVAVGDEGGREELSLTPRQLPASTAKLIPAAGGEEPVEVLVPAEAAEDPVVVEPEWVALLFYRRVA